MPSFMSWIINRLRHRRFALAKPKPMFQFAFYYGHYAGWKHTPRPLIFVMHSDSIYTHGIAVQYMNRSDKSWFARVLYLIKRGGQVMDGVTMYRFIKSRRPSIVKDCYRLYFTSLLNSKMVGAGLTNRYNDVYEGIYKDGWLHQLNENLMPSAMPPDLAGPQISYSSTELRDRIISAQNSTSLSTRSVNRRAPWARKTGRAPWLK